MDDAEILAKITALEKRVAAFEKRFCSRCGNLLMVATVAACGERPCPSLRFLPEQWVDWRSNPKNRKAPARLPVST